MDSFVSMLLGHTIKHVFLHPVTFQLIWDDELFDRQCFDEIIEDHRCFYEDGDEENDPQEYETYINDVVKNGWNWIPFPHLLKIHGSNPHGGNHDVRGGGCKFIPKSEYEYTISSNEQNSHKQAINLRQLTELVYRLKGSKYDYWYELYSSCSFKFEDDGRYAHLVINFDHGS